MFCLRAHRFICIIFIWPTFFSKKYQSPRGETIETVDFVDYATKKIDWHIRQSFVQCGANFSNKLGGNYFDQLNSKLRICLTFDEDWDHEHWIQSQILSKTKAYPYSHLIEPSDFLQPYSEPRKNKQQVKEIVYSHITDSIESVLSDLFY
jgi:hypothetical protein